MKSYDEIKVGDKEVLSHVITKSDIEKFVDLTGDDNKLHIDEEFASKTHFKKPVVHGMLGASFISTIIGTKLPGDGALWFSQTLEFLLPVRIGDKLFITAEVIKKSDRENIIELKTDIFNQNKQAVIKGFAKVKIIKPEPEEKSTNGNQRSAKIALVVGGTGGIGRAACKQLAEDGFNLVIHYNRNQELAKKIKLDCEQLGVKAIIVHADIFNEDEITEMIEKGLRAFGRIDVAVNCTATVIPNIKFENLQWLDFLHQIELNIKSTFLIIKSVVPGMIKNGYGKIINIGSLSVDKPNAEWSHYITAKSALVGLTKSLAFELAPKGIRVNLVTPSMISTELTANIPEKVKLVSASQTPLRRLALTSDIAGAISFLASSKSDYLVGENIRMNGGQIML